MKITLLTPAELEFFDSVDNPHMLGEIYPHLSRLKVGIRTDENDLIGTMSLFNINGKSHKAEFGIHIYNFKNTFICHGVYKVFKEFIEESFERLNLNRIYARVHQDNKLCLLCAKKIGFKYEGTERQSFLACGEYKDILVFSILKNEIGDLKRQPKRRSKRNGT